MDTTIRNVDELAYRALKARAALEGKTVGAVLNEAIRSFVAGGVAEKTGTLRDYRSEPFPKGNERLSEEIDQVAYGA